MSYRYMLVFNTDARRYSYIDIPTLDGVTKGDYPNLDFDTLERALGVMFDKWPEPVKVYLRAVQEYQIREPVIENILGFVVTSREYIKPVGFSVKMRDDEDFLEAIARALDNESKQPQQKEEHMDKPRTWDAELHRLECALYEERDREKQKIISTQIKAHKLNRRAYDESL